MICSKIEKVVVFIMYLWVWWSATSILSIHVKAANDSLKLGDTLNATTELCSKQSKYCMGFEQSFEPKLDPGNFTYLRMYHKELGDWVWIANRDQPVDRDSAVLTLNQSGVLKIESKIRPPIILYSSPQQPLNNSNIIATLLDTGNFVVQKIQPNGMKLKSNVLLWQSFDYPTDSLLPGMKLGVNHKTGHNWSVASWLSPSIPTPGPFRFEWEPRRKELVIKHREQVYWTSGQLRRNNRFEHISSEETQYKIVSNKDEEYFTLLTTPNEEHTIWNLLDTGQLINRAGGDVARADMCYGYNTDGGCEKWEEIPTCRNVGDVFESKTGFPNYQMMSYLTNATYCISDCQAICWSNCSCVGFSHSDQNETTCLFILSTQGTNFAVGGEDFYMLVKNTHHKKGKSKWIWISAATATALLIICLIILCQAKMKQKYMLGAFFKYKVNKRRRMGTEIQDLDGSRGSSSGKDLEADLSKGDDLKVFSYASIMEATNDFSSENKLGQGGFGPVFKGILPSGQEVAVKKLSKTSGQGFIEFKNELTLISKLQHTNLVQLLGHCTHEQERMLIYEYMRNKSLDFFLFDSTQRQLLDWNKRFSIIEGIAQGLLYLHRYSRLRIIHRDLKASNILLDENMNPKISDFGVARMFAKHEFEANTNRIVGTYGYMSPEYAMEGFFSTKSDVYSFGVLLLEIVSGRKNNSFSSEDRPLNLVGHAWELWKEGEVLQLVDPALNDSFYEDEVLRCVHAGLLCVEENADDRPTMSNVISMLTNKSKVSILPKKPAYYGRTSVLEEETFAEEFGVDSTYESSCSFVQSI